MPLQSMPSLFQSIRSFWIYHVISGFFVSIQCTLIVPPDHVIVLLNHEARITCTTNLNFSTVWHFTSTKPGGLTEDVYSDWTFLRIVQDRYNIDNSVRGRHDLLIEKSDPDHAGRYVCKDNEGLPGSDWLTAELTVLDYEPHCRVVRTKDERFIRCNVSYTGNLIPTLQCSDVVRNDSLSVLITSTTDVDSCMLCFQTQGGKCVNRTVVVDDPPITAEWTSDEQPTSTDVHWLSKHVVMIAVLTIVGTIASVFLSLAVICGVVYYRRNCAGRKKSPLPSEEKMMNQSDSMKHSDHTNHFNHTNQSDPMDHSSSGNKSALLETTELARAVDAERGCS